MRLDDDSPVHESNVKEDLEEHCIDIHRDTSRGLFRRVDIQLAEQMTVQDAQYKMEVVNTDEGTVILQRRDLANRPSTRNNRAPDELILHYCFVCLMNNGDISILKVENVRDLPRIGNQPRQPNRNLLLLVCVSLTITGQ